MTSTDPSPITPPRGIPRLGGAGGVPIDAAAADELSALVIADPDPDLLVARRRMGALHQVMRNVLPLPAFLVVLPPLVAVLFRSDVVGLRMIVWAVVGVVAAALGLALQLRYRAQRTPDVPEPDALALRSFQVALVVSLAAEGITLGLAPWVASSSSPQLTLLFVLFPAISGSIAAVVFAGRVDLFASFVMPMLGAAALGLLAHPGDRLHALVGMSVFYGVGVFALHRMVGASQMAAVDLQVRTEQLVAALAEEHVALGDANAQLSTSNAQLAHLALHDPLTGLYNRRGTLERIDGLLAASSGPNPVSLLFCDLDRFKAVNDLLGHRGGDQFIAVIADRIARSIDHRCIAGRIGGDEFVVALPGHDLATAAAVANRLVGVLAQPVHAEGREIPSSVSIGVAVSPSNGTTSSDLLRNANAALYHAKGSGRNRVELFDRDIELEHLAAVSAEHDLRRALELGEILPFFQPEIDASSGRIVGAELLARWLRSDGTVVNAAEFILLAKRAGLLERLTERVLGQARPYIRRLSSLGLPDGFRFRINLGPATTDRSWRDNPIDELVRGLEPGLLTVDVRESAVTTDLPAAAGTLAQFRARGGRVCLDDFARGVSSLSLLRRLPIDEVRIDRQAIDAIAVHPHDRAIVRSIIAVVREIGLAVTAEGVETGAQADALIALGCVRQQGHLYAPALPAIEFESFLLQRLAEGYVAGEQQHADWDEPLG